MSAGHARTAAQGIVLQRAVRDSGERALARCHDRPGSYGERGATLRQWWSDRPRRSPETRRSSSSSAMRRSAPGGSPYCSRPERSRHLWADRRWRVRW